MQVMQVLKKMTAHHSDALKKVPFGIPFFLSLVHLTFSELLTDAKVLRAGGAGIAGIAGIYYVSK